MRVEFKDCKSRAQKAWEGRRVYDRMLRDIYDYMLPMRDVTSLAAEGGRSAGDQRVDKVFDATAIKAAFRFAGRLQTELTPLFQPFFALEAGPLLPDDDQKKALTEELQRVGAIIGGVLSSGTFHKTAHEMYIDLFAGTGNMLVLKGDDHDIVRFRAVPMPELALEEGPFGDIWGWIWKREWRCSDLESMWPKGEFGDELKKLMENNDGTTCVITQYTYYDPKSRRFELKVWSDKCKEDAPAIWKEYFRTSPWITPRFFKVPGEAYGRGPAHLALPFVKTINKARELALKAAAFSILGIWTRRNDGVFNPNTAKLVPGAMWAVGSNGGPLGPTIQRLSVPDNFDVSSIVMEDEREQLKLALFDDTLPPDTAAVRSATEIAERMRRLSQDLSGVYGRLTLEIVVPLVQRVIDIMETSGKLQTKIKIDQMLTQVRVVAPIAAAQQSGKVQQAVNWQQMITMLGGAQAAALVSRNEDLYADMGRWMGVDERYIRSNAEKKQMMAAAAQFAQQQVAADQAAAAPEQPPAAQYVNGGGA